MRPTYKHILLTLIAYLFVFSTGCDKNSTAQASETPGKDKTHEHQQHHGEQKADENDEHEDEHHEEHASKGSEEHEGHHHGGVHLADIMQSMALRFSAMWFAGKHGNAEMLDYQLVEFREGIHKVEEARPKEHGVDVYKRLNRTVLKPIERLPKLVKDGKTNKFKTTYKSITKACSSCHAASGYDFIDVKIPTRNPYTNLDFQVQQGSKEK
jgi:hypothetical protein